MRVEITSYELVDGEVRFSVIDVSEENLQRIERNRIEDAKEILVVFDTKNPYHRKQLSNWLHRQKAVQGSKTWGDALRSTVGTVTQINMKFRVVEA